MSKIDERRAKLAITQLMAKLHEDHMRRQHEKDADGADAMKKYDDDWCEDAVSDFFTNALEVATEKYDVGPLSAGTTVLMNTLLMCCRIFDAEELAILLEKVATEPDNVLDRFYESYGQKGTSEYFSSSVTGKGKSEFSDFERMSVPTGKKPLVGVKFAMIYATTADACDDDDLYTNLQELKQKDIVVLLFVGNNERLTSGRLVEEGLIDKRLSFSVSGEKEFYQIQEDPIAFLKSNLAALPPDLAMKIVEDETPSSFLN